MKYNFISNTILSKLVAVTLLFGGLVGCNDDFLEEKPLDFCLLRIPIRKLRVLN